MESIEIGSIEKLIGRRSERHIDRFPGKVSVKTYELERAEEIDTASAVSVLKKIMGLSETAYGVPVDIESIETFRCGSPGEIVYSGNGLEVRDGDIIKVLYSRGRRLELRPPYKRLTPARY